MTVMTEEQNEILRQENERQWNLILDSTTQAEGKGFFDAILKACNGRITVDKYNDLCAVGGAGIDGFTDRFQTGTLEHYQQKALEALREQGWSEERIRDNACNQAGKHIRDMDKVTLRRFIAEIGFRGTIKSADDARAYLAKHRLLESQRSFWTSKGEGPFPRLPAMVCPEGFVTVIARDARYYKRIADTAAITRDISRYSAEQVNQRINSTLDSLRQE